MNKGIAIFTLLEVGAISALLLYPGFWSGFLIGALFFLEHLVSFLVKRGPDVEPPRGRLIVIAVLESLVWISWFTLAIQGDTVASVIVLAVGLLIGHVIERNTVAGLPILKDPEKRIDESLDFTGIETGTGILWLFLTGVNGLLAAAVLAVGLFIEHRISFRRPVRD